MVVVRSCETIILRGPSARVESEKKGAYQVVKWREKENWIVELSRKKKKNVALKRSPYKEMLALRNE